MNYQKCYAKKLTDAAGAVKVIKSGDWVDYDIVDNCLTIGQCFGMDDVAGVLSEIGPGDTVSLDNSDYIAVQSYYRHQVPGDLSFHAWDQFRDENGQPTLPQRQQMMGYHFTGTGTVQDSCIQIEIHATHCTAMLSEKASRCSW